MPSTNIHNSHIKYSFSIILTTFVYFAGKVTAGDKSTLSSSIRRTASLDALYMRPSWNMAHHLQMQQQLSSQRQVATYTVLQLDKATQTDGHYVDDVAIGGEFFLSVAAGGDTTMGKVMRERLHRGAGGNGGSAEHSVSSQTLSPVHGNCMHYNRHTFRWFFTGHDLIYQWFFLSRSYEICLVVQPRPVLWQFRRDHIPHK